MRKHMIASALLIGGLVLGGCKAKTHDTIEPPKGEAMDLALALEHLEKAVEKEENKNTISADISPIGNFKFNYGHTWYFYPELMEEVGEEEAGVPAEPQGTGKPDMSKDSTQYNSFVELNLDKKSSIKFRVDGLQAAESKDIDGELQIDLTGSMRRQRGGDSEPKENAFKNMTASVYVDNDIAYVDTTDSQIKSLAYFVVDGFLPDAAEIANAKAEMDPYLGTKFQAPTDDAKDAAEGAAQSSGFNLDGIKEFLSELVEHHEVLEPYISATKGKESEYLYLDLKGQSLVNFIKDTSKVDDEPEGSSESADPTALPESTATSEEKDPYYFIDDNDSVQLKVTFTEENLGQIEFHATFDYENKGQLAPENSLSHLIEIIMIGIAAPKPEDGTLLGKYDTKISFDGGLFISLGETKPNMLSDYSAYKPLPEESSETSSPEGSEVSQPEESGN